MQVIKRSGEKEPFSEEKVLRSMRRVGVPKDLEQEALKHIEGKLYNDITTSEIYKHILEFLEPRNKGASIRFNLRQAIFDLGPTGFPFERYLERIFHDQGYKTEVGITLDGDCVTHEIDLLLERDKEREVVEAKFHNRHTTKTDVQVALYVYARFLDVKGKNNIDNVWLVTNTKLTKDAKAYCECKAINAIAWNYPEEGNLQDLVERPHMYPITILKSLSNQEKVRLIEKNIVLCSDLVSNDKRDFSDPLINKENLERARQDSLVICPIVTK